MERQDDLRGLFADLEAKYGVHFLDIENKRNNAKVSYLLDMYADQTDWSVMHHTGVTLVWQNKLTVSKYIHD